VFALVGDDGNGMVWPESLPEEIAHEVDREVGRRPPAGLRLVPEDGEEPEATDPGQSRDRPRRMAQLAPITEPIFESHYGSGELVRPRPALSVVPEPEPEPASVTQLPGTTREQELPDVEPDITAASEPELPPEDEPDPRPPPEGPPQLRLIK
jgi:hypothetical protein